MFSYLFQGISAVQNFNWQPTNVALLALLRTLDADPVGFFIFGAVTKVTRERPSFTIND